MYCCNCGNKIDESAVVCVKCGVLVNGNSMNIKKNKKRKNRSVSGIISTILGVISFVFSLYVMFLDISEVGMYTNLYDRFFYAIGLVLIPSIIAFISFLITISSENRNKNSNVIGLMLSLLSFFFILTEIVIVIIY